MSFIAKLPEPMKEFGVCPSVMPNAKPYPNKNQANAPTHASRTFLIKMFFVFLLRTDPAQSMANPACMKKTKYADVNKKLALVADAISVTVA